MKAKVCIDARMLFSSGIGTYLQHLIPRLEKAFSLILLIRKEHMKWVFEKTSSSSVVMEIPIYSLKEQIKYPFTIPVCDIFWSPHYNIPVFPILAKKRVVTIHDVCHLTFPQFFPKWKVCMASFLLKEAVRRSELVITVSEFSKKEVVKHIPSAEKKTKVVLNGPKKDKIPSTEIEFFSLDNPFILYVGNYKLHKNLHRLLEAFLLLPPTYDLVLVNPEKTLPLVMHPRIKCFFQVTNEELCFLYKKAKLLVHPSLYEGFGLTPLEAMSFGCPVVASSAGSLPEVCGKAAYYVDPYDRQSIYEGMKKVLENKDLSAQLIQAGYEREKTFSWDKAADQLIEFFTLEA